MVEEKQEKEEKIEVPKYELKDIVTATAPFIVIDGNTASMEEVLMEILTKLDKIEKAI